MRPKASTIAALVLCSILSPFALSAQPSAESIVRWLTEPAGKTIVQKIEPITLKGGEEAYLASVEFPDQGRNFWAGYILARPKLKKSILLQDFGGQINTVTQVATFSTGSLVIIGSAGSGQGQMNIDQSVVYFDGWKAKMLFKAESYNNFGSCGPDIGRCEGVDVFINPLNAGDSKKALLAVTQVKYTGTESNALKTMATVKIHTLPAP